MIISDKASRIPLRIVHPTLRMKSKLRLQSLEVNLVFQDIDDDELHPDNLGVGVTVVSQVNQLTVVQQLVILCGTYMLKIEDISKIVWKDLRLRM